MTVRNTTLAVLLLALGCSMTGGSGLNNPSLNIMVSDTLTVPEQASFDFDTKLFRLGDEDLDLAGVDARITHALEVEFSERGYSRTSAEPDLLVSYAVAVDDSISASDLHEAYSSKFALEISAREGGDLEYHQGALIVDVVDRESGALLWRGAISADIRLEVSEAEKKARVRKGAQLLLAHFPRPIVEDGATE